jgi:glutathione reductase (NADPH)
MKIIVDATDVVRGIHIVGEGAAEMIQCLGVAVKMGVTKQQLSSVMPVHPTAAEEIITMRTPTRSHSVLA